jgi:hypothetical protein
MASDSTKRAVKFANVRNVALWWTAARSVCMGCVLMTVVVQFANVKVGITYSIMQFLVKEMMGLW